MRASTSVCVVVYVCVSYTLLSFMFGLLKPEQQFNTGLLQMLHRTPPTILLSDNNNNKK